MRHTYSTIYDKFIQQSPVPLTHKLTPKTFSWHGDQFIMVCNPEFPMMGSCRYYQSLANLNSLQRKSLEEQAKNLGLAMIPALNIDLAKRCKKSFSTKIQTRYVLINIKVALTGNAKIIYGQHLNNAWLHTGKDKYKVSVKLFETAMSGHWKFSVIATSKGGVMLRMKHTNGLYGSLQFQGPIKKNKESDGLVANLSLVDTGTKNMVKVGPLFVGGNFGFKVEITGEWKKWQLENYYLPDNYQEYIDILDQQEEPNSISDVQHIHIMIPYHDAVKVGTTSITTLLAGWLLRSLAFA